MQFSSGQVVVHPHHGPSTVEGIVTRTVRGVPTRYLELHVHRTDLTVSLPLDKAEEMGVRAVYGAEELERLLAVLQGPTGHEEGHWSRRIKDNRDKLIQGDLLVTAGVVRDLSRRMHEHGLSAAEKDMLKYASKPVLGELALSLSLTDEQAEHLLEAAVLGQELPIDQHRLPHAS